MTPGQVLRGCTRAPPALLSHGKTPGKPNGCQLGVYFPCYFSVLFWPRAGRGAAPPRTPPAIPGGAQRAKMGTIF